MVFYKPSLKADSANEVICLRLSFRMRIISKIALMWPKYRLCVSSVAFSVACSRLYNPLCRSVGRSVGLSVAVSFFSVFDVLGHLLQITTPAQMLVSMFHDCPCPLARDFGSRVSGLVFTTVFFVAQCVKRKMWLWWSLSLKMRACCQWIKLALWFGAISKKKLTIYFELDSRNEKKHRAVTKNVQRWQHSAVTKNAIYNDDSGGEFIQPKEKPMMVRFMVSTQWLRMIKNDKVYTSMKLVKLFVSAIRRLMWLSSKKYEV